MLNNSQILFITQTLSVSSNSVNQTIELLTEGATVPFIARYRKEKTGGLDEVAIADIKKQFEKFQEADKRRLAIISSIEEQGKMTPDLLAKLNKALHLKELEDLYLPYKQKRKTKGVIAIEKGLEPLAKRIFAQRESSLEQLTAQFLNKDVKSKEEALQGARDIMAEWINENLESRNRLRTIFEREAIISAKVKKGKEAEGIKYKDYFDFSQSLRNVPSHRLLALRRGEKEGFLKVSIDIDTDKALNILDRQYVQGMPACKEQVELAIEDAFKRLLNPSIENEFNGLSKEKADEAAIQIFATNLRQLLLSAPLGQKRVLALDPGFRTGCKTVVLNELGDLLYDTVVYPTFKKNEAEITIKKLVADYKIDAIAIGNGTASRETEDFVKSINTGVKGVYVVSEQGASIYSASTVAREEFPDKDITVRGAVSIGRRLKDPLAELVKLDPKSIGVGQYQHDVNPKFLKESLDSTVESCVNSVGVELNTASKHLLAYVSGLGPSLAQNVVDYRMKNGKFTSRKQLLKVPRLGGKAYEQAAGFLRIHGAKDPLDNSAVHPERYDLLKKISKDKGVTINTLIEDEAIRKSINLKEYVSAEVGLPTLTDIMAELAKPGRDPREQLEAFEFGNVHTIEDLKEGMVLPGIVTNITAFGCFVDVGVHQDGLVHVSQLANKFIKDPNEVVSVHQKVQVKVMEVDAARKRIALSIKEV
ncbi:Tex family protein [Arcticibacterium luteifluviistationis]|uniref:RNA-binding transcriptional accessory protein n=1 Tax=Arcticibacterium luteifluviistationis TaxID=1784714 RepID=A0A2Z4G7E9_9BACT|nr:Tex family protein [Arcticibacterium luteifluviistationis]AWV97003.1 RNA-binding transcriptional accessory protein [Arcticibacterium luteifluviistationis]